MILYLHKKCSTCQKPFQLLDSKNLKIEVVDIILQPPSIDELQRMFKFQKGNIKKLLNTSGLLYREMALSKKIDAMSEIEIFELLSRHGMLVKRPFLLGKDFGLLGFKEAEWTAINVDKISTKN